MQTRAHLRQRIANIKASLNDSNDLITLLEFSCHRKYGYWQIDSVTITNNEGDETQDDDARTLAEEAAWAAWFWRMVDAAAAKDIFRALWGTRGLKGGY